MTGKGLFVFTRPGGYKASEPEKLVSTPVKYQYDGTVHKNVYLDRKQQL